eukprot:TRINITY_DN3366_c0_g3_i1.p1 TRINITY_DN3366_c0_g3~~TRINITY_DN3366_c0_g3_i1.p1  ORF type:complete len:290 (-),score=28.56 TRINITY_DN3366_c0_g3_i1:148-1017(-)
MLVENPVQFQFVVSNGDSFTRLLQTINCSSVQVCIWIVNDKELRIRWENNSKVMQAEMLFPAEIFQTFSCNVERIEFSVQLKQLMKALEFMSVVKNVAIEVSYPGKYGEVCFKSQHSQNGERSFEYMKLRTTEKDSPGYFTDFWALPETSFITEGQLLKQQLEDMPPKSRVFIRIHSNPLRIVLKGSNQGLDMEFDMPNDRITSFQSGEDVVEYGYGYDMLKTAFCNISSQGINTKVSIDRNGLMKVMHIIKQEVDDSMGATMGISSSSVPSKSVTVWFLCQASLVEEE